MLRRTTAMHRICLMRTSDHLGCASPNSPHDDHDPRSTKHICPLGTPPGGSQDLFVARSYESVHTIPRNVQLRNVYEVTLLSQLALLGCELVLHRRTR